MRYVAEQYDLIRESRKVLLDYCSTISPADLIKEVNFFGRGGSIRNLLVHIANIYELWIGVRSLEKHIIFTDFDSIKSINDVEQLFNAVDEMMASFMKLSIEENIPTQDNTVDSDNTFTLFKVFTHVITHEFHHKGQILTISRMLGYIPADTDIIR